MRNGIRRITTPLFNRQNQYYHFVGEFCNQLCLFFAAFFLSYLGASEQKVLICGVCKDVAPAVQMTIENIEHLGSLFADYRAIIYENNSADETQLLFSEWAQTNDRVIFTSERLQKLPLSRTERIADARNKVLKQIKEAQYDDFPYVVMVDLDFVHPWPIKEIYQTITDGGDWDGVSANGILCSGVYYDRFALRSKDHPFGPELLGEFFWKGVREWDRGIRLKGSEWLPVYSAFGGLAIYKRRSLLNASYSGVVTEDLKSYYEMILKNVSKTNYHLIHYSPKSKIEFIEKTCCEHVPFYATMAKQGFTKFYVNPRLKMYYGITVQ